MASKINADEFVDREGEGKPTLPKGVVLSGVTTITTAVVAENEVANSTGINAGIITSTHFAGNLTGDVNAGIVTVTSQSVIGSAVTISASGIDIGAGVITATSYAGSGSGLTGLGATIMTWEYNPDPSDMSVPFDTGIGITFNQKIKAGSGNITLREDSSSGTVVENFGIGSSVTIAGNELSLTPTSSLSENQVYYLELPSGVITNMAGDNYVGTAYTFKALGYDYQLWIWGHNNSGQLGQNQSYAQLNAASSPIQIPGTTWKSVGVAHDGNNSGGIKTDGTLWMWGGNGNGNLGQNNTTTYSSPIQVGSETTWALCSYYYYSKVATKTDGTLWSWGYNGMGQLGQNSTVQYSSPVQIPGTTWSTSGNQKISAGKKSAGAIKTDGTLWVWGENEHGTLGQNQGPSGRYSSPVQIPGTNWSTIAISYRAAQATKTDGTLWSWGYNASGECGLNGQTNIISFSSPVQIPGSNWSISGGQGKTWKYAFRTDGTAWGWGKDGDGVLGQNDDLDKLSSPTQIGSNTTWTSTEILRAVNGVAGLKTDGTLWTWGRNEYGHLGQNNNTFYSSPTQVGSDTTWNSLHHGYGGSTMAAIKKI